MSPITKRRLAALFLLVFPVGFWALTASWQSGMALNRWNWAATWHFITVTPRYPVLYIALGAGLVTALSGTGHHALTNGSGISHESKLGVGGEQCVAIAQGDVMMRRTSKCPAIDHQDKSLEPGPRLLFIPA